MTRSVLYPSTRQYLAQSRGSVDLTEWTQIPHSPLKARAWKPGLIRTEFIGRELGDQALDGSNWGTASFGDGFLRRDWLL